VFTEIEKSKKVEMKESLTVSFCENFWLTGEAILDENFGGKPPLS
jgi:hypothetical protein